MEHTRAYSVKDVLAALGKSLLYLLFFIMAQFLTGVVYTAAVAVRTALAHREMDIAEAAQLAAERLLAGAPAVALLANVFIVAVLPPLLRLDGGLQRLCRAGPFRGDQSGAGSAAGGMADRL